MLLFVLVWVGVAMETFRLASDETLSPLLRDLPGRETTIDLAKKQQDRDFMFLVWVRFDTMQWRPCPLFDLTLSPQYLSYSEFLRLSASPAVGISLLFSPPLSSLFRKPIPVSLPAVWHHFALLVSLTRGKVTICSQTSDSQTDCDTFATDFPVLRDWDGSRLETLLFTADRDSHVQEKVGELTDARLEIGANGEELTVLVAGEPPHCTGCGAAGQNWGEHTEISMGEICEEPRCVFRWKFAPAQNFGLSGWFFTPEMQSLHVTYLALETADGEISVQASTSGWVQFCSTSLQCINLFPMVSERWHSVEMRHCDDTMEICLIENSSSECQLVPQSLASPVHTLRSEVIAAGKVADLRYFDHQLCSFESERRGRSVLAVDHYAVFIITETFAGSQMRYTFLNTHKGTISITITGRLSNGYPADIELIKPSGSSMRATGSAVVLPADVSGNFEGLFQIRIRTNGPNIGGLTDTVTIKLACSSPSAACFCPSGQFANPSLTSCTACAAGVIQCPFMAPLGCFASSNNSNPPTAFVCNPCSAKTMYLDTSSGVCNPCAVPCKQCLGPAETQCIECYTYASLTAAVSDCKCNAGFYPNSTAMACAACSSVCSLCVNGTSSGCSGCKANAVLVSSSPSACMCVSGYGGTPDNCVPCDGSCLTCSGSLATNCLSCKVSALLAGTAPNSCVCSSSYYPNTTSGNCALCDATCLTCVGGGSAQCASCKAYAYLVNGTSPSSCACVSGYVGTPDACGLCDPTCRKCSTLGGNGCSTCMYYAHLIGTAPSACICDPGFYPSSTVANCRRCHSTCASCQAYGFNLCSSCLMNAELSSASPSSCKCSAGFFPYYSTTNCTLCHVTCGTCRNSSLYRCLSCKSNAKLVKLYFFSSFGFCSCLSGFFPSPDASNCAGCHASCRKCSGALNTQCTACKSYASLSTSSGSSSCICKLGYYMDATFTCVPCNLNCLSCTSSATACSSCTSLATLTGIACSCPTASNTTCLGCHSTCKPGNCTGAGPGYCTACNTSAGLETGSPSSCLCNSGFYPNPDSAACAPCSSYCLTCLGPNLSDCMSCSSNAYLHAGDGPSQCICEDQYFNSSTVALECVQCEKTCLSCSAAGCQFCFDNATLSGPSPSACVCSVGFFPQTDSSNCQPCDSTCKSCDSELANHCFSCYSNTSLDLGICTCAIGFYASPNAANCLACNLNCKNCAGPNIDDCIECFPGAQLQYAVNPGACVCIVTNFSTTDAAHCQTCSTTCLQCSGPATNQCTSCQPHAHLNSGSCVCDATYSPLNDVAHCGVCDSTCATCIGLGSAQCSSCYAPAILSGGSCVCLTSFYPAPTTASCRACFVACLTCTGSGEFECSTCFTGALISSAGNCVCNAGYFTTTTANNCTLCFINCKSCLGSLSTNCSDCYTNAQLAGGVAPDACVCVPGYYPSPDAKNCQQCDTKCATCSAAGPSGCQTCFTGANLAGSAPNSCVCPSTAFLDTANSACTTCYSTCLTCSGPLSTDCTACQLPTTLMNGISPGNCGCPPGLFLSVNTNTCVFCATPCQVCSGPSFSECTACYPSAVFETQTTPSACVCLPSFYPSPDPSTCAPCHSTCRECSGGGLDQCTVCKDLAKVNAGMCECVEDAFANPDAGKCTMCSNLCLKCVGSSSNMCRSCRPGAFLKATPPSECICNPGLFPSPDVSTCVPCAPGCASCTGPGECLACKANAVAKDGGCVCKEGFFGNSDTGSCAECPEYCLKCEATGCSLCAPGQLIVGGKCAERCPPGYDVDANGKCQPLDLNPPVPSLTVNADNSLIIDFDRPMNCTLAASDITVSAQDSSSKGIDITWSDPVSQDPQSFKTHLQFEEKFLGNGSRVILTFLHPEKVTGLNGVPIETNSLSGDLYGFGTPHTNSTSAVLLKTSAATTAAATSKGGVSAGAAASLMNGNPGSLMSLVNQLQLITYLSMSKLPLPTDFASTLAAVNVGQMMPNPLSGLMSFSISDSSQSPPKHVADYGIDSTLFLVNSMSIFMTAGAMLVSFIPIFLLSKVKIPVIAKYFGAMLPSLKWSVPLNLWLTSYLDMGVFCLLQVLNTTNSIGGPLTGISLVFASLIAIVFTATPIVLFVFLYRNFNLISSRSDSLFNKRWGALFESFKPSSSISGFAYFPIFLVRRFVLALTLTVTADYIGLLAVANTSIGVIPYSEQIDQIESVLNEGCTLSVYLVASSFVFDLSDQAKDVLNTLGMWTVRIAIFTNVLISMARTVLSVVMLVKLYNQRMKLVQTRYRLKDVVSETTREDANVTLNDSRNMANWNK